jgi:hypothetical protein
LQTEAFQPLNPPVNFGACRALQVVLVSHESMPAGAKVQLTGERQVQLGPEVFGLGASAQETVEFRMPDSHGDLLVSGVHVLFLCVQEDCSQSLRVEVLGFKMR